MSTGFAIEMDKDELQRAIDKNPANHAVYTQQRAIAEAVAAPDQVKIASRAGTPDSDYRWVEKGHDGPIRLSPAEAEILTTKEMRDAAQKAAIEAGIVPVLDPDKRQIILFPTKVALVELTVNGLKVRDQVNCQIGSINFVNGIGQGWHSYKRIMSIAAAGYKLVDAIMLESHGLMIEIATSTVGRTVKAEGTLWNYGVKLPEHCAKYEQGIRPAAIPSQGIPVVSTHGLAVVPLTPVEVMDIDKISVLVKIMTDLRPGHKEDWTPDGLPDCNRLSRMLKAVAPVGATYSSKVTKKERDLAWRNFTVNRIDPENITAAFAVPSTKEVSAILSAVADKSGLRVLRQLAESKGITSQMKEKDDLIAALLKAGVTSDEAHKLV